MNNQNCALLSYVIKVTHSSSHLSSELQCYRKPGNNLIYTKKMSAVLPLAILDVHIPHSCTRQQPFWVTPPACQFRCHGCHALNPLPTSTPRRQRRKPPHYGRHLRQTSDTSPPHKSCSLHLTGGPSLTCPSRQGQRSRGFRSFDYTQHLWKKTIE